MTRRPLALGCSSRYKDIAKLSTGQDQSLASVRPDWVFKIEVVILRCVASARHGFGTALCPLYVRHRGAIVWLARLGKRAPPPVIPDLFVVITILLPACLGQLAETCSRFCHEHVEDGEYIDHCMEMFALM